MATFVVPYLDRVFSFDAEMLMVLAVERMDRSQSRPQDFLHGRYNDDCMLAVFDYLRETDADMDGLELRPLLDHCTQALKADSRFRRVVMSVHVDDSRWTGNLCPELRASVVSDFAAHFPQYHNLIHAGLLDREIQVWTMDRFYSAGLPGIMHRLPYGEQRRLLQGTDVFGRGVQAEMISFYMEKIEEAKQTIDGDGHRNWWA
jgi:hypothetical protein